MNKPASGYPFIKKCWVWKLNKRHAYRVGTKYNKMLYLLKRPFDKIYFKIEYGKAKNQRGKFEMFYNDGTFYTEWEAKNAFRRFMEV